MQNMIQRLERFGNLGYSDEYGQRRNNKRRKLNDGIIDPEANFYDLDDEWIDDEQAVSDEGDEKDYRIAVERGFYSIPAGKFKQKLKSARKPKQRVRR